MTRLQDTSAANTTPLVVLSDLRIRETSDVHDYVELVSRREQGGLAAALAADPLPPEIEDQQWARRFRTHARVEVQVAGATARLADLSQTGAQLIVPTQLRPSQHVRILMTDAQQVLRLAATVVQVSFEPACKPDLPPHYRAGGAFIDADREAWTLSARNRQNDAETS